MYRNLIPLLLIVFISCGKTGDEQINKPVSEDELGMITASVFSDNTLEKGVAEFPVDSPGQSQRIERAFENAPPMIPHNTEGFFPITFEKNICLSCHLPALAAVTGAIPLPETHFTSLRPTMVEVDGVYKMHEGSSMTRTKTPDAISNAYFSCNQCHVPQAKISVDIENLFTPEFRKLLNKDRSTLYKQVGEGVE